MALVFVAFAFSGPWLPGVFEHFGVEISDFMQTVLPLAAHMFVLYFAVYSSIVPAIAYGCCVAAPIAGGHPLKTAFVALRISIVGLFFARVMPSLVNDRT